MGNRISKEVTIREALAHPAYAPDAFGTRKTSYYVRDAQGNVLSIYDQMDYLRINLAGIATVISNVLPRPTTPITPNPLPLPVFPLALTEQIIYGSSRIGAYKPQRNQTVLPPATPVPVPIRGRIMPILAGQLTLGYKSYELSNHLGNVLTTITDNKMMVLSSGEVYIQSVVLTTQDYYPFGMAMTERGYVNVDRNSQRFGFNGKENDDEWGKTVQDYGFRIYVPGLGKFVSVDPLSPKYPWNSPYAFAENDVIRCIDLEGGERLLVYCPDPNKPMELRMVIYKNICVVTQGASRINQANQLTDAGLKACFPDTYTFYTKEIPNTNNPIKFAWFFAEKRFENNKMYKVTVEYEVFYSQGHTIISANAAVQNSQGNSILLEATPTIKFTTPLAPAGSTTTGIDIIYANPLWFGANPVYQMGQANNPTADELIAHEVGNHNMMEESHEVDANGIAIYPSSKTLESNIPGMIKATWKNTKLLLKNNEQNIFHFKKLLVTDLPINDNNPNQNLDEN